MLPKLKLEDLRIGMEVDIDQLSEIYDTVIATKMRDQQLKTGSLVFFNHRKSYMGELGGELVKKKILNLKNLV